MFTEVFPENRDGCDIMWKKYFRTRKTTDDNVIWLQTHIQNM